MSDSRLKRAMHQFCGGGAHGFAIDELELIEDAARDARYEKLNDAAMREARTDAQLAQERMGDGWTHVRIVLDQGILWETVVTVALFVAPHGYRRHIFEGPSKDALHAKALCGKVRSATLQHVSSTYESLTAPVNRIGRGRYGFDLGMCEACVRARAPYSLRWLPPQLPPPPTGSDEDEDEDE